MISRRRRRRDGYVQGMNDLVAVFLVVLVDEVSEGDHVDDLLAVFLVVLVDEVSEGDHVDVATLSDDVLDDVAADAYGLLNGVLESLDDHYVHRQPGLQRTIEEVDGLLRRVDADLHKHLDEVGVLLLQVTFRWINCLLVRELPMRCAIRLWDTCLAEERGFRTFFPYVCAAFLCHFSDALKAKPTEDVHLFLTSLPTSNWADDEVETLLSEACILSTLFRSAPAHLQHEPLCAWRVSLSFAYSRDVVREASARSCCARRAPAVGSSKHKNRVLGPPAENGGEGDSHRKRRASGGRARRGSHNNNKEAGRRRGGFRRRPLRRRDGAAAGADSSRRFQIAGPPLDVAPEEISSHEIADVAR